MDIYNYVVVGAGGIGHFLAPALAKLIAFRDHDKTPTLYIIDGDEIEDRNLARCYGESQLGELKAEVLADRCADLVPKDRINIECIPEFIKPDTYERFHRKWHQEGTAVFGCVDNNRTRVYLEELVSQLDTGIFVSGGNDYYSGQAQLFVKIDGVEVLPKITNWSPDLKNEDDPQNVFPGEEDCSQEYESEPQLILANEAAALAMKVIFFSQCLDQTPRDNSVNEVLFDIRTGGEQAAKHRKRLTHNTPTLTP